MLYTTQKKEKKKPAACNWPLKASKGAWRAEDGWPQSRLKAEGTGIRLFGFLSRCQLPCNSIQMRVEVNLTARLLKLHSSETHFIVNACGPCLIWAIKPFWCYFLRGKRRVIRVQCPPGKRDNAVMYVGTLIGDCGLPHAPAWREI